MAVTVSSGSTTFDLTTLATVKAELNISSTTYDAVLSSLITQASHYISRYTGRVFAKEKVVETLPGHGMPTLVLSRTPIVSVSGVTYDGSTLSSTTYTIDDADAGFLFKETGWEDTTIFSHDIVLRPTRFGRRDYAVTYYGGYVLPGSTATRTLPYDIERACIDIVKTNYLRRTEDPSIQSQKTGDASESRFSPSAAGGEVILSMSPNVLSVLKQYTRLD